MPGLVHYTMSSRAYLPAALKFAALSGLPFALFWSYFFALGMHEKFADVLFPVGLVGGGLFGVLWGGVMAVRLCPAAWVLELAGPVSDFVAKTADVLREIGYRKHTFSNDTHSFAPSLRLGIFAGRITVTVAEGRATVDGPAVHVATLARLLSERNAVADAREVSR